MSTRSKSRKSSRSLATDRKRLRRKFDPAVVARARELARHYSLILEPDPDCGYFGSWVEFPFVMGDGKTVQECAANTTASLIAALCVMIEHGDPIPAPARDEKRSEQVNIRLTALERLRLETLANQQGFRSISDYIRASALGSLARAG